MNGEKITMEMLDEYKNRLLESKRLIPVYQESNGDILYLKDYSKIVRGIGSGDFRGIPERLEDENITILENPTEEEKVILATNLPNIENVPYLAAIINGRGLLATMSRDEAAIACRQSNGKLIEMIFMGNAEKANEKELELLRTTKAYLDGSLYGKSIAALNVFANASLITENQKENMQLSESEEIENKTIDTPQEEVQVVKEEEKPQEPQQLSETPIVEIPTVEAEKPASSEVQPAQESVVVPVAPVPVPESTISPEVYDRMVQDVVGGKSAELSQELQDETELPGQSIVSVAPQVPETTQMAPEQSVATQPSVQSVESTPVPQAIPAPDSLMELSGMVEDDPAPSFDGELGGRGM